MIPPDDRGFLTQKEILQKQLKEQRQKISQQLLVPLSAREGYPRSMTIRFLVSRPGLVMSAKQGLAMLVGIRFYRLMVILLVLIRLIQSVSAARQKMLPAPHK